MSSRPNYQGSRRGGRGGGGGRVDRGGGGGGRGGGRGGGGQRWWDPAWRAERLQQIRAENPVEVFDEKEWWSKLEKMKGGGEQELIVKKNFGRDGQQIMGDMAYQLGLYFQAYNKGKTLVVSKVPLPNYRADLDERHGSTQKEIRMSTEIERKVGNLLAGSSGPVPVNGSAEASSIRGKQISPADDGTNSVTPLELDTVKEKFSAELKKKQDTMMASESSKVMLSFREKLPAYKTKAEFLNAVADNQVLVVSGETGCGKTTQLPQFILEEEISHLRGADCNMICTQPRRISAISVSARIAAERGESIGATVGFQIRLEANRSAQTRLLFCTTGVVLRRLVQDPNLTGVSHLLVDEIHERGLNEDFLLIILLDLLPRRPDLRVILMSATINADMFSKYFGNAPTIHIPGFTFPVTEIFLEDVLEKTNYHIESEVERRKQSKQNRDPLTELFEVT